MAETVTPRFGVRLWGAGTDTVSRTEFNQVFQNIEDRGALDSQGVYSARPTVGVRGRFYYATDRNVTYRDTGTAWMIVGSVQEGFVSTPANVSSPAIVAKGLASQSQDILQVLSSTGAVLSSFTPTGGLKSGGVYVSGNGSDPSTNRLGNAALSVTALLSSAPGLIVRAASGHSASILDVRDSANNVLTRINQLGEVIAPALYKAVDTNPTKDHELVTYGTLKRLTSDWDIQAISQTAYNALPVKDTRTLYVITS